MRNSFKEALKNEYNYTLTENGALAYKSTLNMVYDLFAFGGAYRNKSDRDCILLFKNALEEDKSLAMKCLFYLRDCRGGQGERRFFRVCIKWLAEQHPAYIMPYIQCIPEYGRYDDLFYLIGTPLEKAVMDFIHHQLTEDMDCKKTISLLAKWLPSENTSSRKTKELATKIRIYLNLSSKEYRKILSSLREKIRVTEKLMSEGRWDEIEFDKIPSKAGFIYRNAFARRDIIAEKYKNFMLSSRTKVKADTLYPHEIVSKIKEYIHLDKIERAAINKYWDNQIDYLNGKELSMLCVIDTSGSMTWGRSSSAIPIDAAVGLGIYAAERMKGPFANYFISFSRYPSLVKVEGVDFVDKVKRIKRNMINENTNLTAVFNMLLRTACQEHVKVEDIPEKICIISDMQIDNIFSYNYEERELDLIRRKWEEAGYKMPHIIYWNVNAAKPVILDKNEDTTYVSGCSPTIFKNILTGKTGWELCLETLLSKRYDVIK